MLEGSHTFTQYLLMKEQLSIITSISVSERMNSSASFIVGSCILNEPFSSDKCVYFDCLYFQVVGAINYIPNDGNKKLIDSSSIF